jgi:hypothetical protein
MAVYERNEQLKKGREDSWKPDIVLINGQKVTRSNHTGEVIAIDHKKLQVQIRWDDGRESWASPKSVKPIEEDKTMSKKTTKKEGAKPKAGANNGRYTRVTAFCEALRAGGTVKEITARYVELYVSKTLNKRPSDATAAWAVNDYLQPLLELGYAKKDDGGRIELIN